MTPAQYAMRSLLGKWLQMGMPREWTLADRIRHGHESLVKITKIDLGYDPVAWHEHLRATDEGGYRWEGKNNRKGTPRLILRALEKPAWHRAVASLRSHTLDPRWQTADVMAMASGIAAERSFNLLPILADLLEEAGCNDEQILNHCRRAGAGQLDSWVIHLLLGTNENSSEQEFAADPAR